jgi:hypothetical protein
MYIKLEKRFHGQASARFGMLDVRDCASFQHGVSLLVIWLDGWLTLKGVARVEVSKNNMEQEHTPSGCT